LGSGSWSGSRVIGYAADWLPFSVAVSSGFIARLDFGELARWGRKCRYEMRDTRLSNLVSRFSYLALALLVLGVFADDANDAAAVDDLALVADRFYGCSDLHKILSSCSVLSCSFLVVRGLVAVP
jgi:hypothetical protein